MTRVATNSDVFSAIAEPKRRAILIFLAGGERAVQEVVFAMQLDQPAVSKHLRVLRDVGLVTVRRKGRQRLYSTNGEAIKPVHDWARSFEDYWTSTLERIKCDAEHGDDESPKTHTKGIAP